MINNGRVDYIEFPAPSREKLLKTKSFYSSVFGWNYKDWGEDYSDTHDSGVNSGLNGDMVDKLAHTLAVIHVEKLEAAKEAIVSAGGQISRDIFLFPGGRRFHFIDPAGNEVGVWSEK
jgi:predicted enzyme related to lactoylglutathione lyase